MKCYFHKIVDGNYRACGKCFPCKMQRINDWTTRLHFEELNSHSADFVTLTYNYENLKFPSGKARSRNYGTLYKRDVQLFIKRLRRSDKRPKSLLRSHPIKYISCGEYGTKNKRPHYHLIIFNATQNGIDAAWRNGDKPMGQIHYDPVNPQTIAYVVGYIANSWELRRDSRLRDFQLQLPFLTFSKGLGANYVTPAAVSFHTSEKNLLNRCYVTVDGQKRHMPKYLRQKIYSATAWKSIKEHLQVIAEIPPPIPVPDTDPANIKIFNDRILKTFRKETIY
ncbi:MAG: replication initiator protein [Microviridae sp.]|nr:MAG: replication initiator protein [Microviridae sp.]